MSPRLSVFANEIADFFLRVIVNLKIFSDYVMWQSQERRCSSAKLSFVIHEEFAWLFCVANAFGE